MIVKYFQLKNIHTIYERFQILTAMYKIAGLLSSLNLPVFSVLFFHCNWWRSKRFCTIGIKQPKSNR